MAFEEAEAFAVESTHCRKNAVALVPMEVGAPANGIDLAINANALTPRHEPHSRYLGSGIQHHGTFILQQLGVGCHWKFVLFAPTYFLFN
jgi:hypothetical protein